MRGGLAGLVAVVAALVLPVALVSVWTAERVTDRDGYVAAVAPLASDPVVRREVSDRLVTLATRSLGVDPDEVVPGSGQLADLVVEQSVATALRSAVFERTWTAANRGAHGQLLAILRGADASEITLDLAPVLDSVLAELATFGLPATDRPNLDASITLATPRGFDGVQRVYGGLADIGYLGVVAWLALVGLALLVARRRSVALVLVTVTTALSALATLGLLMVGRSTAVGAVQADDRALLDAVSEVLIDSLQTLLVGVLIGAGVVGAVALVAAAVTRPRRTA